jgi:hypothetical protein
MADASSPHEFDLHVLQRLEKLFGPEELEILVWPSDEPAPVTAQDCAVLVRHQPTGREAMSFKRPTQIQNKICCLLELLGQFPRLS